MNSLVQFYRQNNPNDASSDEEIIDGFVSRHPPETLAQYPDFLADWQKLQSTRAVESSGIGEQFSRGFSRGVTGLETSAAGIGALAADTLGMPGVKSYLLDIYKNKSQQAAEETPASVPTIQGALAGPSAFGQYVAGKTGELVPAAGEALAFALAGTAAAPGPGTEAGLAAGIFGRAAARSAIKKAVEGTLSATGRKQLEDYAAGKVVESALEPAVAKVIKEAAGHMASLGASAANFAALGAGGAYGELSGREGVTPEAAKTGALIAGAGASIGALIPERLIKSIFGEKAATETVRTWIDSKAITVPKELLVAGSGMGAMEFFNILGERYADPKKREEDFSKEDYSRMLNAVATGVLAGAPAAGITALRGGLTKNLVPTPEEPTPPADTGSGSGVVTLGAKESFPGTVTPPSGDTEVVTLGAKEAFPTAPIPKAAQAIMDSRRLLLEAQTKAADELRKASKKVAVPETPAEERLSVVEEIRKNEARTTREVQDLFPAAKLSREQAAELRRAAWGAPDEHVAKTYGAVDPEKELVLRGIAMKEIAGALSDADRIYVQKLSAGEKETYKQFREEAENATNVREGEGRVPSERGQADAVVQKEAPDRNVPPVQQKEGAQASAGHRIQQAASELAPEKKAALASVGVNVDALTVPTNEVAKAAPILDVEAAENRIVELLKAKGEIPHGEFTYEGMLRALGITQEQEAASGGAGKGLNQFVEAGLITRPSLGRYEFNESIQRKFTPKSAAGTEVPKKAEAEVAAAAPAKVEAGAASLRDPSWVSAVPESYGAWVSAVEGKEKLAFSKDHGFESTASDKEKSNTKAVFQTPDGNIAVATIKKTRGVERVEQGPRKTAKTFDTLTKEGWKLLGYSRGVTESKFFREHTPEEWAGIQAELEAKTKAGKEAVVEVVPVSAAEAVTAGLSETGGITSDVGKGALTQGEVGKLHDAVIAKLGGIPPDEAIAKETLADVLLGDKALVDRIREIGGKNDTGLYLELFDRYEAAVRKFHDSGSTDPVQFRSEVINALAGLSAKESKAGTKALEAPPDDLRKSEPAQPDLNPGSETNVQVAQHVTQQLADIGIPVQVLDAKTGELVNGIAKSLGSYDRAAKTVTWALSDVSAPKDLDIRVLFEEATHALFDRESPEMQEPILRAISKLDERSPGELDAVKADIAHAYPNGLRPEVYQEELMAGWLTRKLQAEGFNPLQAHGIGQQIVRMLKDLYLKASMWFQSTFLGEQYNNPDLALRYFQNRMEGFLAGDKTLPSFVDMLGGRKATHGEAVSMQQPSTVSRALAQTFDPNSGLINTAHLVEDSVEAAVLNGRGDEMRYSLPAPAAVFARYVDPSVELNRDSAANNELKATQDAAGAASNLERESFRKLNGLTNTDKIGAVHAETAARNKAENFNPAQRLEDFSDINSVRSAGVDAVRKLTADFGKIGRNLEKDRTAKADLEAKAPAMTRDAERALDRYTDAGFMEDTIRKGVRKLTLDDIRQEIQTSKALGMITQIGQQLEGKIDRPVDPKFINALRRLHQGPELQGTRLFDLLDQMANDPSIDFTRPATKIRQAIRQNVEAAQSGGAPAPENYLRISGDTDEGRALLATVIAYGKTNANIMAGLELRKAASGTERVAIEQKLKDLWKETRQQIDTGIKRVAKSAKLEERAKGAYREILGRVMTAKRNTEALNRRIAVNERAIPVYQAALDRINPKIEHAVIATFGDGMKVRLPESNDVHPAAWREVEINTNAAAGDVTSVRPLADRLAEWTKSVEEAAKNGDETALGIDYRNAKQQLNELVNSQFYERELRKTDQLAIGLAIGSPVEQLRSSGTPSGDQAATMLARNHGLVNELTTQSNNAFGHKVPRAKQAVLSVLNKGTGFFKRNRVSIGWFDAQIRDAAKGFLEKQQFTEGVSQETQLNTAYAKLGQWLLSQPHIRPILEGRMPEFMPAFRDYLESNYGAGQWWNNKGGGAVLGVEDPRLGEGHLRAQFEQGMRTFHRTASALFSNMVHTLRASGWTTTGKDDKGAFGAFSNIKAAWDAGGRAGAESIVEPYVNHPVNGDTVQRDFLFKVTHVPDESPFQTIAVDEAGTSDHVDPMLVSRAYDETGGNIIQTFERLFQLQGGTGDVGQYVQDQMLILAKQANEASSVLNKIEPKSSGAEVTTFHGLVPQVMIDARRYPHWPSEWFTYPDFDQNMNARMAESVAGQLIYGRNSERFANAYDTVVEEMAAFQSHLRNILKTAERDVPSGDPKQIDAAAIKLLDKDNTPALQVFKTGKERLAYLRKVEERAPLIKSFLGAYTDFYRRGTDQLGNLRWGIRFSQFLSGLLVNNPATAITQMGTTMDITAQWGSSPAILKATRRAIQMTVKDIAGGLAQGIGWQMARLNHFEQKFNELGLNDPISQRRFGDLTAIHEGEQENPGARILRIAKEAQSFTLNRKGAKAEFTPIRPLAPFSQMVFNTNRGLTIGLWELANDYVSKGVKYLQSHPGETEITAEKMGLKGLDIDGFNRWSADAQHYGFRFTDSVRGAADRVKGGDNTLLTNEDLSKLYSLGLHAISLEPSVATMNLAAYNNSVLRFGLPMLGWSWRRAVQVGKQLGGLGANDRRNLKSVGTAMLGLAATGLGGLGLSLAVDAYQEDVVGKKRNIRGLKFPTTGSDILALQERMARVGTLGMWGDLINSAVNVGTGQGDNRMLSLDQRVVALQSFQTIQKAISSFINQDFDPDYQHVVRPMAAALGGNGMLQYMQIANHAFDLDNVEARYVKRVNAENYLRVTGRDLQLGIKTGGAGYSTPTPITPWISRMEYAAFGNDPAEFREMYRGAVAEAKASGKPDPAEYVKRAFETKHPLRYVFTPVPSEREYRQILSNLDDQGREAVTEAVRLFNYYGSHLGITPFQGSKKAQSSSGKAAGRARAMAF